MPPFVPYNQRQQQQQPQRPPQTTPFTPYAKAKPLFDLNTDFGQLEDAEYFKEPEKSLLEYVTSVNIPCCVHEGDPKTIIEKIKFAKAQQLVVGAHIGYPDPKNKGYQSLNLDTDELKAWVLVQLGAFYAFCKTIPVDFLHIRPHGALYLDMARDENVALAVAQAIHRFDPWLTLVMPISPTIQKVQDQLNLQIAQELYVGKRVTSTGTQLIERGSQQNLSFQGAIEQVRRVASRGQITAEDGRSIDVNIKTFHISPKQPDALNLAQQLTQVLQEPTALTLSSATHSGWISGTSHEHLMIEEV